MKKILGLMCMLAIMNGYNANASSVAGAVAASSAASSNASRARYMQASDKAAVAVAADSFLSCETSNGVCILRAGGGCAPEVSGNLSYKEYLRSRKPNATYAGFSYDSYNGKAYIYYNE